MGVDLSGQTREAARQALLESSNAYLSSPIVVSDGEQRFTVTPQELGLTLQVDPVVEAAYGYGRTGSALTQWRQRAPILGQEVQLDSQYSLDRGRVEAFLSSLAPQVARSPIDSVLSLGPDGKLRASAEQHGQQLDVG